MFFFTWDTDRSQLMKVVRRVLLVRERINYAVRTARDSGFSFFFRRGATFISGSNRKWMMLTWEENTWNNCWHRKDFPEVKKAPLLATWKTQAEIFPIFGMPCRKHSGERTVTLTSFSRLRWLHQKGSRPDSEVSTHQAHRHRPHSATQFRRSWRRLRQWRRSRATNAGRLDANDGGWKSKNPAGLSLNHLMLQKLMQRIVQNQGNGYKWHVSFRGEVHLRVQDKREPDWNKRKKDDAERSRGKSRKKSERGRN